MADAVSGAGDELDARLRVHRDAIDALDREVLLRLNERAMHAKAIGDLKAGSGTAAYRPDREAQVLARLCEQNGGPLSDAAVVAVFRQVMSACLALEQRLRVAYLGPAGTFSHAAGTYSYTVTDANGCTATTTGTITEPTALTASSSATAILCNGGSSTVTVSATRGTAH